jgi:hypothetical protein
VAYDTFALATFDNMLGTLDHLVERALAAGLGDEVLATKLADDMFPLELQFRVAINQPLLALQQVCGRPERLHEEPYGSLRAVRDAIAVVRARLKESKAAWPAANGPVDLTLPNGVRFAMSREEDIRDWLLPNFYFHVTMAYALLRGAGLEIGKMDFLPHMARHTVANGEGPGGAGE